MSHSWTGKNGTQITYNPDLSEVVVSRPNIQDGPFGPTVELDGQDLLEFVADYVRGEKISQIDDMSIDQLLGLKVEAAEAERKTTRVDEVARWVREGGYGAGGIKYDDVVEELRSFEGKSVPFTKLAEILGVSVDEASELASDLLLSRHSVVVISGPGGSIELEYEPEQP